MHRVLFVATLIAMPTGALADGGDDTPPPKPAVTCASGQIYDEKSKKCVKVEASTLDRDALYSAVRQLAYAGRYHEAQIVLDAMDENDPGRLTYMGFTYRKLGDTDKANAYYEKAIAIDPANHLARSYMGQGFVAAGRIADAKEQLQKIQARGGTGTWSETSLRTAIATGSTYSY
ncbi:MAG: tetratricopeptide repeat protein [Roseobacter sp.]